MKVIKLTQDQFSEFIHDEVEEIKKHKWIESERVHRDLGSEACFDWINHFVDDFKKDWVLNHFDIEEDCIICCKK